MYQRRYAHKFPASAPFVLRNKNRCNMKYNSTNVVERAMLSKIVKVQYV